MTVWVWERARSPRRRRGGGDHMGAGIAQVAAMAGYEVVLQDVQEAQLARARATITSMLDKGVERGKVTEAQRDGAWSRLTLAADLPSAVERADLVIEAIPEKMEWKAALFREIEAHCPAETLFASNTSSLSISRLAAETGRADRFLGMHFFNPVPIMKLLELVVGEGTSEATLAAARAVGDRMGKSVIVVKDAPGFATSRLGIALGLEAIRMVEQGVASAEDIDLAMTLGYGHPMGPLRLTDLVGLDVRLEIARYLHGEFGDDRFAPPSLLERMVEEGRIGKKAGRGFYDWD
ncbi:MAG: 3-hydroxyacyl-CoA dehydrogenase family protein [Candidatus Eisenbacteria bacterium]